MGPSIKYVRSKTRNFYIENRTLGLKSRKVDTCATNIYTTRTFALIKILALPIRHILTLLTITFNKNHRKKNGMVININYFNCLIQFVPLLSTINAL